MPTAAPLSAFAVHLCNATLPYARELRLLWPSLLLQDWLREEHPDAYQATQYRCIEISPVLAALQRQHVAVDGGHALRFAVRRHDAADAAAWAAADAAEAAAGAGSTAPSSNVGSSRPRSSSSSSSSGGTGGGGGVGPANGRSSGGDACCFIVMTEVLDNLPHDR
jgi:uncharacterized membrane protein YgcG